MVIFGQIRRWFYSSRDQTTLFTLTFARISDEIINQFGCICLSIVYIIIKGFSTVSPDTFMRSFVPRLIFMFGLPTLTTLPGIRGEKVRVSGVDASVTTSYFCLVAVVPDGRPPAARRRWGHARRLCCPILRYFTRVDCPLSLWQLWPPALYYYSSATTLCGGYGNSVVGRNDRRVWRRWTQQTVPPGRVSRSNSWCHADHR